MVDIRTIEAKSQTEALATARIEYGTNFTILGSKEVATKGILGIGAKKKHQLRIMLLDSIYDNRKKEEERDNNNSSDTTKELSKHSDTIDGKEIGERVVALTKMLQQSAKERSMQQNNQQNFHDVDTVKVGAIDMKKPQTVENREVEIDKKVAELVEDKVKNMMKDYMDIRSSNNEILAAKNPNIENRQRNKLTDYLERSIIKNNDYDKNYSKSTREVRKTENIESLYSKKDRNKRDQIKDVDGNITPKEALRRKKLRKKNIAKKNRHEGIEESMKYLRMREFPEAIVDEMKEYLLTKSNARFVQSPEVIQEEVIEYFSKNIKLLDGIEITTKKKIIVLVGPTGVGKTTTIPKIAAIHLKSGKKVSFVTIDNYRIAAVDQLNKYAEIMKVPFASASTPEALRAEIRKMEQSSILFVDTMGRSPKGAEDIIALSKYFSTVGRFDIDIQLVMSSTVKYNDALSILDAFKLTNYKGVILTKLDETDYLASSVSALYKREVPISYATFGQRVPQDIATGVNAKENILNGLYGK